MAHSQVSPIIPFLIRINPVPCIDTYILSSIFILSSHLQLRHPDGLFLTGLPVKILKVLLHSLILATFPAHGET